MAAKATPTELEQVTADRDALRDQLSRLSGEHARLSDNHMRILTKTAEWERRARAAYLADAQAQTARYATYAAAAAEVDPTYLVGLDAIARKALLTVAEHSGSVQDVEDLAGMLGLTGALTDWQPSVQGPGNPSGNSWGVPAPQAPMSEPGDATTGEQGPSIPVENHATPQVSEASNPAWEHPNRALPGLTPADLDVPDPAWRAAAQSRRST